MHHAAVVPVNPVRDPVNLDQEGQTLHYRNDVEAPAEAGEPVLKLAEAAALNINTGFIRLDTVLMGAKARNFELVSLSSIA